MTTPLTFLSYLQTEKIKFWQAIAKAVDDGLIFIDDENEAITASNLFLRSYPDLHEVLNMLVETWIERKSIELIEM